jgi:hypothetical protein
MEISQKESKLKKFLKLLKRLILDFLKFYILRGGLGALKYFLLEKGIKKFSQKKLKKKLLNSSVLRTALFISLMPFIYELISMFGESVVVTFIAGFVSSFVGILISEKSSLMGFIILSVIMRSMHSLIVVWMKKLNYKSENKVISYSVFLMAMFGMLFICFFHPTYKPISRLVFTYANFNGNEKQEMTDILDQLRIV